MQNKDIDRIKDYEAAIEDLHNSMQKLTYTLPNFSEGLQAGLSALADKLPEVAEHIAELNKKNKELVEIGQKPQSIFKQLASSLFSWNTVVSVGITLISTYGKEILSWVASLFKAEEGSSSYSKALKNSEAATKALIEAQQKGNINAQEEIVKLKLLYNATQNKSLADNERKKAVDELRKQYPGYFNNLSDEAILTGKATKKYEELSNAILATARARAAQDLLVKNQKQQLINEAQLASLNADKEKKESELNLAKAKNKDRSNMQVYGGSTFTVGTTSKDTAGDATIRRLNSELADTTKQIEKIEDASETLNVQNERLIKSVADETKNHGVKILTTAGEVNNGVTSLQKDINEGNEMLKTASEDYLATIAQQTIFTLKNYNEQVQAAQTHFDALIKAQKGNKAAVTQLEKEKADTLKAIATKFQQEELSKLHQYETQLKQLKIDNIKNAKEREMAIINQETAEKEEQFNNEFKALEKSKAEHDNKVEMLRKAGKLKEMAALEASYINERMLYEQMAAWKIQFDERQKQKRDAVEESNKKPAEPTPEEKELTEGIKTSEESGHHSTALQKQIELLDLQHNLTLNATNRTEEEKFRIENEYKEKRAALEEQLVNSKIHAGDKYIDAVMKNTKKDSAIYKAAFIAKKATAIADVIISTKKSIISSFEGYAKLPFIGQALAIAQGAFIAAQGAASIAQIAKQKPGFAAGGQFVSDGRGALLAGYSRTDNTNAYLRSGEAVVVSEAMRNPWARNLVSAINVAHGGRDFSTRTPSGSYALGGVFTDGGNANRYYAQPVNDVKDLANTLAYQLINNFPPVYVDVKDINTQQSILAHTVDRVNL